MFSTQPTKMLPPQLLIRCSWKVAIVEKRRFRDFETVRSLAGFGTALAEVQEGRVVRGECLRRIPGGSRFVRLRPEVSSGAAHYCISWMYTLRAISGLSTPFVNPWSDDQIDYYIRCTSVKMVSS